MCSPKQVVSSLLDTTIVATLGNYTLRQLGDNRFELTGPDNRCPTSWLMSQLPKVPWFTAWVGSSDTFILRIFR